MRVWFGMLVAICIATTVAGCSSFAGIDPHNPAIAASNASHIERVFVASTRAGTSPKSPDNTRLGSLKFAAYEVAVPPKHQPGDTPYPPVIRVDPSADFLEVGVERFRSATGFATSVAQAADQAGSGPAEALVFVHGFNSTFQESVVRMAQIGSDMALPSAQILYAWPSDDRLLSYLDDAQRAAKAKDGLAKLLQDLAASSLRRIVLVGYSMGAATVVDALAELRSRGGAAAFAKIDVVLLSPDLDLEHFRQVARGVGSLPRPIVVYGAHDDFPLKMVAAVIDEGRPRLGALPDPDLLADIDMTYVDVAEVRHTGSGHMALANAPALIAAVNAMAKPDLVRFATVFARTIPGAQVSRHGAMTYIVLPPMGRPGS